MKRLLPPISLALLACSPTSDDGRHTDDALALEIQLDSIEALFTPLQPIDTILLRYVEFFTRDAVLLPPGADPVVGSEAILAFYIAGFKGLEPISLEYSTPEVLNDGDLAVRRYEGMALATVGSDTLTLRSRYVDVLRRTPLGWRIHWHTWSAVE